MLLIIMDKKRTLQYRLDGVFEQFVPHISVRGQALINTGKQSTTIQTCVFIHGVYGHFLALHAPTKTRTLHEI